MGIPAACQVRLAPTRRQPWYHTHTPSILKLSASSADASSTLSSARITLCLDHRLRSFWITLLDSSLDYIMDDKHHSAKDVPVATNVGASTSSTPSTAVDLYARRSCPRCGCRMSSLQFDKHTFCVICRDMKCSLATRCKECKAWSKEFMLGYAKHQRSQVTKGKRIDYTIPFSSAACNSGSYHFLRFFPLRVVL